MLCLSFKLVLTIGTRGDVRPSIALGCGTINFKDFGELILRHQRLMTEHDAFMTYFVPIYAEQNDSLSIKEMNLAMKSISEPLLTREEINFLQQRTTHQSFTWNQFIELLLLT